MNATHWARSINRILWNLGNDAIHPRQTKLAFTRQFLSLGNAFQSEPKAPSRHFLDIFPSAEQMTTGLGEVCYTRSNATPLEVHCICCIARMVAPSAIFEFGTFDGWTTRHLAKAANTATVFTLDLAPADVPDNRAAVIDSEDLNILNGDVGKHFRNTPESARIKQLLGNSTTFDYGPYHGQVQLTFIDACHDYEHVRSDTVNALKMVTRGVIIWHDYCPGWPGVVKAVDDLLPEHPVQHIAGTSLAILLR